VPPESFDLWNYEFDIFILAREKNICERATHVATQLAQPNNRWHANEFFLLLNI